MNMKKIYTSIMLLTTMMAAMISLTGCEKEDDYIARQLREGDWQGYVGAYYADRWGISGSEYATVMRFESKGDYYTSGRGYELNYNTRSPHRDYACYSFKWFIVDGDITLIYDDDKWTPLYIVNYSLSSSWFRGYINSPSSQRIKFEFENIAYDDWGYYKNSHYGNYGDFSNQSWYRSRTPKDEGGDVPFVDRTELVRQKSGEPEAISVASGEFAKAAE